MILDSRILRNGNSPESYENDKRILSIVDVIAVAVANIEESELFKVDVDSNGGSSENEPYYIFVNGETFYIELSDPEKEGNTFLGWFKNEETTEYDFDTPIEENFTLYAHWEAETFTVSFNSDGGSEVESQTVEYGECAEEPADPTKAGKSFAGWFLDEEEFDFSTEITEDTELTAHWTDPVVGEGNDNDETEGDGE